MASRMVKVNEYAVAMTARMREGVNVYDCPVGERKDDHVSDENSSGNDWRLVWVFHVKNSSLWDRTLHRLLIPSHEHEHPNVTYLLLPVSARQSHWANG